MARFIYNLILPFGFIFFVPQLILKFRNRGGWKSTYAERFGRFSPERKRQLAANPGAIWIHAVSVGETVVALSFIRRYLQRCPERRFVLSTTTTTGQELARKNAPEQVEVIFCPIDFLYMVKRVFNVIKPCALAIFETELWPNLIGEAKRRNLPVFLLNGRMSDHSSRGYSKIKWFFAPMLNSFTKLLVQTQADAARYLAVAPQANVMVVGNQKFDQNVPENIPDPQLEQYFGAGQHLVILGASTHPGEEVEIAESYRTLKQEFPELRLILIPRHAERGAEVTKLLTEHGFSGIRKSSGEKFGEGEAEVLIADTTGEMFKFMKYSDVVIMGKSLAGNDEGHNLIEPALLAKPIVTGHVLRNFRFLLDALTAEQAILTVKNREDLIDALRKLAANPDLRRELGGRAAAAIARHKGAVDKSIDQIESALK